ncbi:hypothetical protein [Desmospora profundinema]|uniref:Uncharacterized protein n=1 Tax=Desmospora profundinema TaxID=1571184 RepID=A0ABU1IL14_9BACL|nr:hypothetical protein [Desmospora profundinema]MDR6225463.1 hypothetical protein [Desmospora profundinema]
MRKAVSVFTAFALLMTLVVHPSLASATQTPKDQSYKDVLLDNIGNYYSEEIPEITDLVFITQTEEKLEYTYTKDNKQYKNVEFFNEDGTEVTSHIYEKNQSANGYEKKDHLVISLNTEESKVTTVSKMTNESTVLDLGEDVTEVKEDGLIDIAAWKYKSTSYGSNKPQKWTVAYIGIVISYITKLPVTARLVTSLAAAAYGFKTDTIYYKTVTYLKTGRPKLNPCMKRVSNLYANKKRTKVIKTGVVSYTGRSRCP